MDGANSICFGQGVAASPVHPGSGAAGAQVMPGTGMIPAGMGSLLLGAGKPAPGGNMVQPRGYLVPAGYSAMPNVLHAGWNGVAVACSGGEQQQPQAGGGNGGLIRPPQHKGPWTEGEDETLKALVTQHGERKWAVICRHLPGRIGKQCRERWTNHLRPGIDKAKSIWTEKDDEDLIRAHKIFGNRWSMIARTLEGRSENSVKNHWNATRRSLKAMRRLKKKKNAEAPPGKQWSILEEYIRSLPPAVADAAAASPPPPDSPPSSYNTGYGSEVVSPPAAVAPPQAGFDPAAMGLYLNASSSSSAAAANLGLDLNAYYQYYGAGAPLQAVTPQMMGGQDLQQALPYPNMITYHQFVDNLAWHSPSVHADANNNANAYNSAGYPYYYYYGEAAAGPSGTAGVSGSANPDDDGDVVQMASREFQMNPSEDEVTLNLAGFM